MGKPVNHDKNVHLFGSDSGRMTVTFHNGTSSVTGHIIKQVGTTKYKVSANVNGSPFFICKLARTTEAASTLTAGMMRIEADVPTGLANVADADVVSGGAGYAEDDTLTIDLDNTDAVLTVATVDGNGAITAVTVEVAGACMVLPGIAQDDAQRVTPTSTSGAGTGATFDLTFAATVESKYVKKLMSRQLFTTDGIRAPWSLDAATPRRAKLKTKA